jgi:glycosyltransferase involved in cell wall biosynthesis
VAKEIDFTVITPVYNGAKYIRETVESVLNFADTFNFEYLVVNDGSSDSTKVILQEFKHKIQIIDQENSGESAAVNRGIKEASGKYILVVSADDPLISSQLFSQALDMLGREPELAGVYPDWQIIDSQGNVIKKVVVSEFDLDLLIGLNKTLPGPGTVFRKDLALQVNGRSTKWKYVGDYDFWLRLSLLGNFKRIPGVLAQWRGHEDSASIKYRNLSMANERIDVILEFLTDNPQLQLKYKKQALGNAYYLAARLAFFDAKVNGRKLLIQSFLIRRRWVESAKLQEVIYLLFLPWARVFNPLIRFVID